MAKNQRAGRSGKKLGPRGLHGGKKGAPSGEQPPRTQTNEDASTSSNDLEARIEAANDEAWNLIGTVTTTDAFSQLPEHLQQLLLDRITAINEAEQARRTENTTATQENVLTAFDDLKGFLQAHEEHFPKSTTEPEPPAPPHELDSAQSERPEILVPPSLPRKGGIRDALLSSTSAHALTTSLNPPSPEPAAVKLEPSLEPIPIEDEAKKTRKEKLKGLIAKVERASGVKREREKREAKDERGENREHIAAAFAEKVGATAERAAWLEARATMLKEQERFKLKGNTYLDLGPALAREAELRLAYTSKLQEGATRLDQTHPGERSMLSRALVVRYLDTVRSTAERKATMRKEQGGMRFEKPLEIAKRGLELFNYGITKTAEGFVDTARKGALDTLVAKKVAEAQNAASGPLSEGVTERIRNQERERLVRIYATGTRLLISAGVVTATFGTGAAAAFGLNAGLLGGLAGGGIRFGRSVLGAAVGGKAADVWVKRFNAEKGRKREVKHDLSLRSFATTVEEQAAMDKAIAEGSMEALAKARSGRQFAAMLIAGAGTAVATTAAFELLHGDLHVSGHHDGHPGKASSATHETQRATHTEAHTVAPAAEHAAPKPVATAAAPGHEQAPAAPASYTAPTEPGNLVEGSTIHTPGEGAGQAFVELKHTLRANGVNADTAPPSLKYFLEHNPNAIAHDLGLDDRHFHMYKGDEFITDDQHNIWLVRADGNQQLIIENHPDSTTGAAYTLHHVTVPPHEHGVVGAHTEQSEHPPAHHPHQPVEHAPRHGHTASFSQADALNHREATQFPRGHAIPNGHLQTATSVAHEAAAPETHPATPPRLESAPASIDAVMRSPAWATYHDADIWKFMRSPEANDVESFRHEILDVVRESGTGPENGESLGTFLTRANEAILHPDLIAGRAQDAMSSHGFLVPGGHPGVYEAPDHKLVIHGGDQNARLMLGYEFVRQNPTAVVNVETANDQHVVLNAAVLTQTQLNWSSFHADPKGFIRSVF